MRVACVVLFLAAVVSAGPIQSFEYTATGNGGVVVGAFGYDLGVPDANGSPTFGDYPNSGFIAGTVTGGPQDGVVFNVTGLRWGVFTSGGNYLLVLDSSTFIGLDDLSATAFADDSLPTSLDLADFDFADLALSSVGVGGPGGQWFYEITSISTPVPEPGSLALLGGALIGYACYRRRKATASA